MKMTVGKKIGLICSVILGVMVLMNIYTYVQIGKINKAYTDMVLHNTHAIVTSQDLALYVSDQAVALRRFGFTKNPGDVTAFGDSQKKAYDNLGELEKALKSPNLKELLPSIKSCLDEYGSGGQKVIKAVNSGDQEGLMREMQVIGRPYKEAIAKCHSLVEEIRNEADQRLVEQQKTVRHTQFVNLLLTIVAMVASLLCALPITRNITTHIFEINRIADKVAHGDLTESPEIKSNDEIGDLGISIAEMIKGIKSLVNVIQDDSQQITASSEELTASSSQSAEAANQIATSITDVARGADDQLDVSNNTFNVVERINKNIELATSESEDLADKSVRANLQAEEGNKAVEKAVTQMTKIEAATNVTSELVGKLGERSQEISQIVSAITDIAAQTNLLALNAAIEAARAGEHGKGFAVVAEEVRKLAEQSAKAAGEITGLVQEIQVDTEQAVHAMEEGVREIRTGATIVNETGDNFRNILQETHEVSAGAKRVSETMEQITSGSREILDAVKRIDELSRVTASETQTVSAATEEQLASMEQISASSQMLTNLAEELQHQIERFKI